MREDDSNGFARWEEDLPTPEELMPISQNLITPDLALAFNIPNPNSPQTPPPHPPPPSSQPNSSEFDSADPSSGAAAGDEPARTLKRPRLVWTPQLHKRFVDAVAHLGIKNAVPKTIMQLMSVDGLTRENVASHLQKYRLYLKRMQGLSSGGAGGGGASAAASDPATDHLFASSPVPPHFLHAAQPNSDNYLPFVPVVALQPHHHHPQMHPQYHHSGGLGQFGSRPNGQFEHRFLARTIHGMGAPVHDSLPGSYGEDLESATATTGRKALTLFPAGED